MDGPPHDRDDPEGRRDTTQHPGCIDEEVCPQQVFDCSFLGSGQQEEIILRDRIPVGKWQVLGLSVRTHAYRGASGARFAILVRGVAPSSEDGADFVTADLASFNLGGSFPNLQQLTVPLTDLQVPCVRILLRATGPTSPPGPVYCEMSCDLILKAGD